MSPDALYCQSLISQGAGCELTHGMRAACRYFELKAQYLPQMSAYLDPLESAHSMALFYPDRMSSLTAWFRRVTCESLRILSESLGFTPTGVWEALPAPLEKLRKLRTLLRRQKVRQSA